MLTAVLVIIAAAGLYVLGLTLDGCWAILRRRHHRQTANRLTLQVTHREHMSDDIVVLRLKPLHGRHLPPFRAGQHLQLSAPCGPEGRRTERAYSLSAWQARPQYYELGIRREPQGLMSDWIWRHLHPGTTVEVRGPLGRFSPGKTPRPLALVGAGIGVTPLRAMVQEALHQGREVALFHTARTLAQLAYHPELAALATARLSFRYHPTLTRPGQDWTGRSGRWTASSILQTMGDKAQEADFYLCASGPMLHALREDLLALGVPGRQLHQEAFSPAASADPGQHQITVQPGGRRLTFSGQPSLLAALEQAGVPIPSDCRNGSCGACKVACLAGLTRMVIRPEHEVGPHEVLACCCTPASDLQIRLDSAS